MSQPSIGAVGTLNAPLTDISIAVVQEATAFGATRMMQDVPVLKKSSQYQVYEPGEFHRTEARLIAPGSRYPRSGYNLSDQTYNCKVYGVERAIPDQIRENAAEPLSMERDAVIWGTHQMLLKREKDFLNTYFTSGIWTGGTGSSPTTKWDAGGGGSTPLNDIRAELLSMQMKTGHRGNVIGMPRAVWNALIDNPQVIGRLGNDERKMVQQQFVASLLEVDEIVVFDAIENTAAEGAADVNNFIASSDDVLILHRPANPGLFQPAALYNFTWSAFTGAGPAGNRVMTYRHEEVESDVIRTQFAYDQKLIASDLGSLLENVLS